MNKLVLVCFFLLTSLLSAQTGKVNGLLIDKDTGDDKEPVAFASVILKGTNYGTTSDIDGKYSIAAPAGSYTLVISFVGMKTVEIPDVVIRSGFTTTVDVPMSAEAASLDAVSITVAKSRESAEALLEEQKKSVVISQSIGAEELSQKGVSDAEGAVTKVSGISKQSGVKNVFVRGLGDRYNTTTLNGLPVPSDDPEFKNISLDVFTSDIIQAVDVNKVFLPNLASSNLGGANINVSSKQLSGLSEFKVGIGSGFNTEAIAADNFLQVSGGNFLGTGVNNTSPVNDLTQYNFEDSFGPENGSGQINLNGSISGGKRWSTGDDSNLEIFGVLSFDSSYLFQEGNIAQFNNQGGQGRDQDFEESVFLTSQLGLISAGFTFDDNSISYNGGLIRNVSQSVGEFLGENQSVSDQSELEDFTRRQQVNKNNLIINQILSSFKLQDDLVLNVNGSYNLIRAFEPDRRVNNFIRRTDDGEDFFRLTTGSAGLNHRFFSELSEDDIAARISLDWKFNYDEDSEIDRNDLISVGYNYRDTKRLFEFRQFSFQFNQQTPIDLDNPEDVFNQTNLDNGLFEIITDRGRAGSDSEIFGDVTRPFFYDGDRVVHTAFINGVYDLSEKLTLTGGLKYEQTDQVVDFDTSLLSSVENPNIDPSLVEEQYLLPSVAAKYSITENSIVRVGSSLSYILPEFKEVAPFLYEDVNFSSFGNPDLIASDIFNIDVKFEYYISRSEVFTITGFYKNINNPINRVRVNSASNDLSYVNVGDANVAGIEIEFRKNLIQFKGDDDENLLQFGFNGSYLNSRQDLIDVDTDDLTVRFTNDNDQLEGASPFLVNTDLTYNYAKDGIKLTSSVVANFFSDRIFALGTAGNANFVEESRVGLDFINSIALNKNLSLSLKAKNILNPDYQISQEVLGEDLAIETYKRGLNFSLGLNYQF